MRELAIAIVAAAAIIGAAIIFQPKPEPQRFLLVGINDTPFRVDTKTGEVVMCSRRACLTYFPAEDAFSEIDRRVRDQATSKPQ